MEFPSDLYPLITSLCVCVCVCLYSSLYILVGMFTCVGTQETLRLILGVSLGCSQHYILSSPT